MEHLTVLRKNDVSAIETLKLYNRVCKK